MKEKFLAAVLNNFEESPSPLLLQMLRGVLGPGEIEVAVHGASVNPIDIRRGSGYGRRLLSLTGAARLPIVLGNDFAGTITRVGSAVTNLKIGDAVFGAIPPSRAGTHASYVIVAEDYAVRQPSRVPTSHLATLPYNYITVTKAISSAGLQDSRLSGADVLIHGGTGGLGLLAVRLLKQRGATVAVTGSVHRLNLAKRAGASLGIERRPGWPLSVTRRFDATLNFGSWDDEVALLALLKKGAVGHATTVHPMLADIDAQGFIKGGFVALRHYLSMRARVTHGARYSWVVFRPDRDALERLPQFSLTVPPPACSEYALESVAKAYSHVEKGLAGRAVITPIIDETSLEAGEKNV